MPNGSHSERPTEEGWDADTGEPVYKDPRTGRWCYYAGPEPSRVRPSTGRYSQHLEVPQQWHPDDDPGGRGRSSDQPYSAERPSRSRSGSRLRLSDEARTRAEKLQEWRATINGLENTAYGELRHELRKKVRGKWTENMERQTGVTQDTAALYLTPSRSEDFSRLFHWTADRVQDAHRDLEIGLPGSEVAVREFEVGISESRDSYAITGSYEVRVAGRAERADKETVLYTTIDKRHR